MKKQKVVIIGGGIAGSYAAYLASKKGYNTTLYERISQEKWVNDVLRGRECGEGVWQRKLTKAGIETDLQSLPEWVENATTTLSITRVGKDGIKESIQADVEPYLFLNRKSFEDYYLGKAKENGAKLFFGECVKSIDELQKRHKDAYILCAWGSNAKLTASISKGDYPIERVLTSQHTLSGVNSTRLKNAKGLYLSDDPRIKYFYIFPKADVNSAEANVGVAFNQVPIHNPYEILWNFIELNPYGSLSNADALEGRTFSKVILARVPSTLDRIVDNDYIFPLGDAGYFISSVSGGGIGYALLSARIAVQSLSSENPQKNFFRQLEQLAQTLDDDVTIGRILFPNEAEQKKFVNEQFLKLAKGQLERCGSLSMSLIMKEIYKNLRKD